MLEDINVFCAIAKHQSFAKAARELEISTPVATRRLARLEETLATRLLNRTTRKVTLTEAGNVFYREVNEILQTLEASKESVKSLTTNVTGTIKIGLPTTFSQTSVMPVLHKFIALYPNLKLQINTGGGFNQLHFLNEGYDLVIHCGPLPNSNFHYKKLGYMKKILCASPEYLQKFGLPKTIDELTTHNCLSIMDAEQVWELFDNGVRKIPINGNVQVSNSLDLKILALSGMGIINIPHYLIIDELKQGKLVSILDRHQLVNHEMYAVYPTNKFLNKKTKIFLDYASELLAKVFV